MSKSGFYNLDNILNKNCIYNMIIGERSNGKTYSCLKRTVEEGLKGNQTAYVRRLREDMKNRKNSSNLFSGLIDNNVIYKLSGGLWDGVKYWASAWYFSKKDDNGKEILSDEPFMYFFALSEVERDKGASYPKITTIIFDEFLTRGHYLNDEFVLFMNLISTIVRLRDNVIIFMLGNTVNKYSPYFEEMGLYNIKFQKRGTIDVYRFGDAGTSVAVEYSDFKSNKKNSNIYFAFDNPRLKMITGGEWELRAYPHLPLSYKKSDVIFKYFIIFNNDILQCNIISTPEGLYTFIHKKTTLPFDNEIVFTTEYSYKNNIRRNITIPMDDIGLKIFSFFKNDKVFYQSNEIGEIINNYLNWCKS